MTIAKEAKGRVTVRLQDDIRRGLQNLAAADKRAETNYIRKVLWNHVEAAIREGKLPPEEAPAQEHGGVQ